MKQGEHKANSNANISQHGPSSMAFNIGGLLANPLLVCMLAFGMVERASGDGIRMYNCVGAKSNYIALVLTDEPGITDSYDGGDSSRPSLPPNNPYVISSLPEINLDMADQRTSNPTNLPFKLKLVFSGIISTAATNKIYFRFPVPTNTFGNKYITFQECDADNVGFGPNYDIRDTIANSSGIMYVGIMATGTYSTSTPYKQYLLWITNGPTYNVIIHPGVFSVSPTNFQDVPEDGSVTTMVESIYVTNSPGLREKFTGFQKTQ